MGLKVSHILVLGLSGSGKTHLLDFLSGEIDATRQPTNGYHEISYPFERHNFIFTEYGGRTDWETLIKLDTRPYRCIYMIIRDSVKEANNALLMVANILSGLPIAVVWNSAIDVRASIAEFHYPRNRQVCSCSLNFANQEVCLEKIYRLLQWTAATLKDV